MSFQIPTVKNFILKNMDMNTVKKSNKNSNLSSYGGSDKRKTPNSGLISKFPQNHVNNSSLNFNRQKVNGGFTNGLSSTKIQDSSDPRLSKE